MDLIGLFERFFDPVGIALAALVFLPLERLMPERREQGVLRAGWTTDLIYLLINGALIRLIMLFVVVALGKVVALLAPHDLRAWVGSQPIWVQAVALILIADFGFYWAHRLFHAVPFLWRFHAVHHSIEHLDWLASFRVHPLDQAFSATAALVPMLALGFSDLAVGVYAVTYRWQSLMLHSNVRLPLGRLALLIATPEFHRWHHSRAPAALNKNYGGQTGLWDWIFGTWRMPVGERADDFGVEEPLPNGYVDQLLAPFRRPARAVTSTA
jgi:sterol desaturase/sphingolipid hydroxylase (fatty acid hydroxylase superfamily)